MRRPWPSSRRKLRVRMSAACPITLAISETSLAVLLSRPCCWLPVPKSGAAISWSATERVPIMLWAMSTGMGGICTACSLNGKICPGTMRRLAVFGTPFSAVKTGLQTSVW